MIKVQKSKKINMKNLPAKLKHFSFVIVHMLTFSSVHHFVKIQRNRAASMTEDSHVVIFV